MTTLILLILVVLIAAIGGLYLLLGTGSPTSGGSSHVAVSTNLRSLVAAQRQAGDFHKGRRPADNLAIAAAAESQGTKKRKSTSAKMTLEKRMRYAKWPITPIQLRAIQFVVWLAVFIPAYMHLTYFMWILTLLAPAMVGALLDRAVKKRFKAFDDDYPVLLMSYVSLLKTGQSAIGGLEAAAKGLDDGSLVRSEVELLIERLRLGLTEEQAISAFGEDIAHPELELFVQSLILSRRVGGALSHTLERLAKQVRKRQQFRQQAVAAVGMERSSIYMIALIMSLLLGYLVYSSPELVLPAFEHELGLKIFQAGIALIAFGFYWSKRVTDIKV